PRRFDDAVLQAWRSRRRLAEHARLDRRRGLCANARWAPTLKGRARGPRRVFPRVVQPGVRADLRREASGRRHASDRLVETETERPAHSRAAATNDQATT